jgi:WD40 repeat protein
MSLAMSRGAHQDARRAQSGLEAELDRERHALSSLEAILDDWLNSRSAALPQVKTVLILPSWRSAGAGAARFAARRRRRRGRTHPSLDAALAGLLLLSLALAVPSAGRAFAVRGLCTGALLCPCTRVVVLALHGLGSRALAGSAEDRAFPAPAMERRLVGHGAQVWSLAFSPDGQFLASGSVDGTARIWRVGDGAPFLTLPHPIGVTSVVYSPDGRWLATGSYDGVIRLWDAADGRPVREMKGHQGTVWSLAFHPGGALLASGGNDTTVRVWGIDDGRLLRTIQAHRLIVWSVAFSPDGEHLASGSFDHEVKLWRVRDGALVRTFSGHRQAILSVAFSPDGRTLVSGGDDKTVRLWRTADGRQVWKTWGDFECVYSVAFSPDGRTVVTGGRDKSAIHGLVRHVVGVEHAGHPGDMIRLWRGHDGALLARLSGHREDVYAVRFSPDGKRLATAGDDGKVVLWRLHLDQDLGRGVPRRGGDRVALESRGGIQLQRVHAGRRALGEGEAEARARGRAPDSGR